MLISNENLSKLLLDNGLITEKVAVKKDKSLWNTLIEKEIISDENLGKLVADYLKTPFITLTQTEIDPEVLKIVPEIVAKKQQIIAFKKDKQGLHVGMADPEQKQIQEFLSKKEGQPIIVYLATERDIDNTLRLYSKDFQKTFEDIISESVDQAKKGDDLEPPIITIVNTIIDHASRNKASDVHIEPEDTGSLVRFRIDGILHDILTLPMDLHSQIVTRIKVLSKLRTDEHASAQDGKIEWSAPETTNETLDIRTSIVPITKGEKIVMRLLSERSRQFSLTDLGFSATDLEKIKQAYGKPHGMILSTGPTGCGKTTTMYALLKILNKRGVNIMTIEDPVEYSMEGVNQIQVNPKTNLTFAAGLRSVVRQDPDIILVGEIRDEETAGIAINSAMTGHLLLSTLHTNDAATAIPRLLDMKIEPFLIASTVNIIIGQRLVRKICLSCRESQDVKIEDLKKQFSPEIIKKHFSKKVERLYVGKGCPVCHDTGYVGRIGIFEILIVHDSLRDAINSSRNASDIKDIAVKNGMTTMLDDGLEKIKNGLTTVAEILRVTTE